MEANIKKQNVFCRRPDVIPLVLSLEGGTWIIKLHLYRVPIKAQWCACAEGTEMNKTVSTLKGCQIHYWSHE